MTKVELECRVTDEVRSPARNDTILDIEGTGQWMAWSEHFGSQLWEFFSCSSFGFFYFSNCGGKGVCVEGQDYTSDTTINDE